MGENPSIPTLGLAAHLAGIAPGALLGKMGTVNLICTSPIILRSIAQQRNAATPNCLVPRHVYKNRKIRTLPFPGLFISLVWILLVLGRPLPQKTIGVLKLAI